MFAAALGGAATFIVIARDGAVFEPVGILTCIAVVALTAARAVVTVERHGVRARVGLFGFPRRFFGTDTIKRAVVVNVRPMRDFKGWGDRSNRRRRAYIVRRGEALRLEFHKGQPFVVTIDDARRAADRVNAFVDELRRSGFKPEPSRPRKRLTARVRKGLF